MGGRFYQSFNLLVPGLDNYTYNLFKVRHGPELYPIRVIDQTNELKTEEEFVDWLRQRLSSDNTRKIVSNLLAQATS
jgi:hypothetical protein